MQTQEQIRPWQVTIAWTETSDVKLKFLEIFGIFGACGNLNFTVVKNIGINSIYFNNFKNRCILCDVYSTHVSTIIHVDTFHGSKGDLLVSCAVTSCKIRNHYIVANLDRCSSFG